MLFLLDHHCRVLGWLGTITFELSYSFPLHSDVFHRKEILRSSHFRELLQMVFSNFRCSALHLSSKDTTHSIPIIIAPRAEDFSSNTNLHRTPRRPDHHLSYKSHRDHYSLHCRHLHISCSCSDSFAAHINEESKTKQPKAGDTDQNSINGSLCYARKLTTRTLGNTQAV